MKVLWTVLAAALLLPAAALGQQPARDPGTSRTTFDRGNVTVQTYTAGEGALRCVAIAGAASSCSPPQLKEGALLVGHRVTRGRLGRLVVAGLAGRRATTVSAHWRGRSRTVRARRFGAYLFRLPQGVRQRDVMLVMRHRGGGRNTVDFRRPLRPRWAPIPASERVDQLLLDTDGSRMALLTWRAAGGQLCGFVGDVVGVRVGSLRGSWFTEYPINQGGNCVRTSPPPPEPLLWSASSGEGRRVISGFARADVVRVELREGAAPPRPVTLSGRRAFAFVSASTEPATLTAVLRDGQRVDQPVRVPPLQASRP